MNTIKLPQMIDYYRIQNNLTMKELGEKLGKSESAISKWIKGVRSPMIEDLEKLSELFGVSVEMLMFGGRDDKINQFVSIVSSLNIDNFEKAYDYSLYLLEQQKD